MKICRDIWLCFAVTVFASVLTLDSAAQKTVVNGRVLDAETSEPLPFVNVAFKDSKIGTTTDMQGRYSVETYYATDSLVASFVGYRPQAQRVRVDETQTIDFHLDPGSVKLTEVVISAQDEVDPALELLEKIIRFKPANNREKLDAYSYEVYNRIQFDLNNLTEKFTERKIFKEFDFIFDHLDSSHGKVALPFFITESLSDYYYRRQPKGRKEIIKATKVSGINNESITQFLGQMYQDVNVYSNSVNIFGKNFVSPISDYAKLFYEFTLIDSSYIDGKWCYRMDFVPKNKNELVFKGHFWVNDTTYAIKEIDAHILPSANINFITDLKVHHLYDQVQPEVWMLTKEELLADFTLVENETGFYGHKTTTYTDFTINQPRESEFYGGADHVKVESQVNEKDEEYWSRVRHEDITAKQQAIYQMVDSLKSNPVFMTYVDIVNFIFQGYWVDGPVEYGPVFTFLSYNAVEGLRPKFGLRTSNAFSTRLMLEGYAAYGLRDERFKYMLGGKYFLSKDPRQSVSAYYSEDYELVGQAPNYFSRDHFIQFLTSRNPQDRLIFNKEARLGLDREWFTGFSTQLEFRHRRLSSAGDWNFERYAQRGDATQLVDVEELVSTEISFGVRFAYRERFVEGEFERISLGSLWPIVRLRADFGIEGVLGSQYDYQKLTARVTDKVPVGPLGNFRYDLEAGKTWKKIPYPLQFVHPGSESIFLNEEAFNTMNFFEFVSDQYVSARAEHHFEGLFFNKIPLFQKLKWREIVGVNAIYGSYASLADTELVLPRRTYVFETGKPFVEAYVGVENIVKFLRVDAIWRLSYLDHPQTQRFTLQLGFLIQF